MPDIEAIELSARDPIPVSECMGEGGRVFVSEEASE